MALTFDLDHQIILKCQQYTYGIWFDRNRLQDHQIPGYINILPDYGDTFRKLLCNFDKKEYVYCHL